MKSITILSLILFFGFAKAQTETHIEIQQSIVRMYDELFSKADISTFDKYFVDEVVMFEDGFIFTADSIRSKVIGMKANMEAERLKGNQLERQNQFEFIGTSIEGNSAFVFFKSSAGFLYNGMRILTVNRLESARFIKRDGLWKISFLHSSSIKEN
jgi:hypothetical protein